MLFKFARSRLGSWSVGWMMEHWSVLLPVDRLFETPRLVAFRHPRPVYTTHILIVPKKSVQSLIDLADQGDEFSLRFIQDLLVCVRHLVTQLNLDSSGYRMIVNGG